MSFELPSSTEVNRQLPKKAIIEKFGLSGKERSRFDSTIHRIIITDEISSRTVNIPPGDDVKSIFILKVELQSDDYDEKVIAMLFKLIEQNMVIILQSGIRYRPIVFRDVLIQGEWTDDLDLKLSGLDLDEVWENIIKDVRNIVIEDGNDLDSQIIADENRHRINLEIQQLEKRMAVEKQPRRKREIFEQIKIMRKSLN